MPRKPRIHFPGAIYHCMMRGNYQQNIFFSEDDREYFYKLLEEAASKFNCQIHSFCLMTNHVHLLIEVSEIALSKIMQNIIFRFARWINKKFKKNGHLFQNRYKAILVQSENYLLELCRYIHLNPLKAKLVETLIEYRWSSHRAYLNVEKIQWITTDLVLSIMKARFLNKITYKDFMEDTASDFDPKASLILSDSGRLITNDAIILKYHDVPWKRSFPQLKLEKVIEVVCEVLGVEQSDLFRNKQHKFSEARAFVAFFAHQFGAISLKELAAIFNRDISSISHGIYRLQMRRPSNSNLALIFNKMENKFLN